MDKTVYTFEITCRVPLQERVQLSRNDESWNIFMGPTAIALIELLDRVDTLERREDANVSVPLE
jgi:hypothetical protein